MNSLQKKMLAEMQDKSLFEQAQKHAFQYLDEAFQRNVYPSVDALEKLKIFDEEMPEYLSDGSGIIELLHQYGSPATVSQIGGRYFGFVNGSALCSTHRSGSQTFSDLLGSKFCYAYHVSPGIQTGERG